MGSVDKSWLELIKVSKFFVVGISNTLITWAVFYLLINIDLHYLVANLIAYFAGMTNGFIWSKRWVFQEKERDIRFFLKFTIVNLITLGTNTVLLFTFVTYLGLEKFPALVAVTAVVFGLNYLGNRLWTFRQKEMV